MSGTWATARAAIKNQINGVTFDLGAGFATETLTAYEFAPPGRQSPGTYPYAFLMPAEQRVTREPGMQRITTVDAVVRVMLATPANGNSNAEVLQRRYDACVEALKNAFDDAVALDGNADIFLDQSFSGLEPYDDIDLGWGFEMTLGTVAISETKAFGV